VQAERVLTFDGDGGTFDPDAAAEVFGRIATPNVSTEARLHALPAVFHAFVQIEEKSDLGMRLDITPKDRLRINEIKDTGPIAAYNACVADSMRLKEGDFILSVNGVSTDCKAKVSALAACGHIDLEIGRALTFVVSGLDTSRGKLGLDLAVHPKGTVAYIKSVFGDGLIQTWNQQNPESDIRSGDMIIAINGVTGTSKEVAELAASGGELELTITRPAEA